MNYNRGIFTFSNNSKNLKLLVRLLVRYGSISFTVAFSLKNKTVLRNDVNACKTTALIIEASSPYSSIISTWYFSSVTCLSFTVSPSMSKKKKSHDCCFQFTLTFPFIFSLAIWSLVPVSWTAFLGHTVLRIGEIKG